MAELLLELLSEEIPARMQGRAADDLARLVTERLTAQRITFGRAEAFSTPRRLTLVIHDLADAQPDRAEERRGPRVGAPEQALAGFLAANNADRSSLIERETPKGSFWFLDVFEAGRPTIEVLPELIAGALADLPWPKSMRWGAHQIRWVRPLRSILCLFGGAVVPVRFGHLTAGNTTQGHRFLAPATIEVHDFAGYRAALAGAHVVLDAAERRRKIASDAAALASDLGLMLRADEGLLEEVAGLVEWPTVLAGRIDDAFMDVPSEVLVSAMRTHQRYFVAEDAEGRLAPVFVLVSNLAPDAEGAKVIVHGNERVLRARLADAKFFWDTDRQTRLDARLDRLQAILFQAKLGTVADKAGRIAALARQLAAHVPGADPALAERAGRLAKADLVTGMVGEFPEIQGIMGRYYATHDGEPAEVAQAIGDHYAPAGASDGVPTAPLSVAVALADKLDTLAGFFAIDEKPTGSKDPFALRRAALGVLRILIETGVRLPLKAAISAAAEGYRPILGKIDIDRLHGDLMGFFADRLKVLMRDRGVRHDLIAATLAGVDDDDVVRLLARVRALQSFLDGEDGANLLAAYRRASNIVRIEEKKDGTTYGGDADAALLVEPEEMALHGALVQARADIAAALAGEEYERAMTALAGIRVPVDAFFDRVTVNCDMPERRRNRLHLLSEIRAALEAVADFSKIEG